MIKFLLGFVSGVISIWLYGLFKWYKMTADEWNELLQDMTVLPNGAYDPQMSTHTHISFYRERKLSESTT